MITYGKINDAELISNLGELNNWSKKQKKKEQLIYLPLTNCFVLIQDLVFSIKEDNGPGI